MEQNERIYIPRGTVTQYFTDAFIKNNKKTLLKLANQLVDEKKYSVTAENFDDLIDKAVFATMVDVYAGRVMEKDISIADLVEFHMRNILK